MFATFRSALARARQYGDLHFAALVDQETISAALGEASSLWQGWIYTPAVTVWVFLSQCLSADHSCREAVARLAAWRVAQGLSPCSSDTGAYCTAREAIPDGACQELVHRTGRELEEQAPQEWLWRGRRVRVVDGSTITMPDTAENQAEYPQANTQAPGCGLREVRVHVKQRGFRTKAVVIVTTLRDPHAFPAREIADLYRRRWQAELHLRSLKVVLQMDHLRCKTPHRVRNEFFVHLLAYNLVRRTMTIAAAKANVPPWQISFKGALQTLSSFLPGLTSRIDARCRLPSAHRLDRFACRGKSSRSVRTPSHQTTTKIT